jgi:DNA-binding NarL/FixJ family response regulator
MITLSVIEDHPVFRQGLAQLAERGTTLSLLGTYRCVEDFLADDVGPDVTLLDLHLPGLQGADAVRAVVGRGARVLVVSAAASRDTVLDAIAAGAHGYLTKEAHPDEIVTAITVIGGGGTYVSATLASYLLQESRKGGAAERLVLSDRETEVLTLLAQGERDADIAERLFISISTVRSHLDRIRDKTGHRRRPDLTRYAIEHGLLPPTD